MDTPSVIPPMLFTFLLFYSFYAFILLLLNTLQVAAVACVNLHEVAFVNEERHTDLNTSLKSSRLQSVCSCIALDARLRVCDAEVGLNRHLTEEHSLGRSVRNNFDNVALLHEVNTSDEVARDWNLVVCLLVHEDIVLALLIEVLVRTTLYAYILELLADVEATLQNATVNNVLQLNAHESVTLAWFYVKEVDDEEQLAIHADAGSHLDVL